MLTKIIMPSGGQTTNESLIVKWNKNIGDIVKKGDVLFEIETDKAVMQIESYAEGTLLEVKYAEGEYAATGEVVAYIGDAGEKLPDDFTAGSLGSKEDDEYQPIMKKEQVVKVKPAVSSKPEAPSADGRILASPAARLLARNESINLNDAAKLLSVQLLKKKDIAEYIQKRSDMGAQEHYFVDTTSMRKTIARRMTESVSTAPHFTVSMDIDMTQAIELRQVLNENLKAEGVKVSFNDIIIKCVSKAIKIHPIINSTYNDDKIKVYNDVNFGLAVGLENGLVVPVVRQTDKKSIAYIAKENSTNIDKAKSGKLQAADMSGGTITLSNLGMYGVDCFTAIINQPESCILAVGGIIEKPVVYNGMISPRHIMSITASFDHRIIDGAVGAAFLKEVRNLLEKPQLLLI